MYKIFIFYFLVILWDSTSAQKNDSASYRLKKVELELQQLQKRVFYSRREADRLEANKEFISVWKQIIDDPEILNYPFDSLKKDVSVLTPSDKKFKLITWDFHRDDGTFSYFGFLLVNNSKRIKKGFMHHTIEQAYEAFPLIDVSATVKSPETYIGMPNKWFGMLYTQLIECDGFYTLIGWDGNNNLTQRKFIDVLSFKDDGTPVFGKDVFRFPRKNPRRLMFEWSSQVSMSVRYNEKRNLIIYSHLVPNQREGTMEGQLQFYGPDSQFDALELKRDNWVTIENVEANSDIDFIKESKKPKPKKQTPVYKPK